MKYLSVSLFHPRVIRGGAQYVAKDVFDAADADPTVDAVLLAGINAVAFANFDKTGAAITRLPGTRNEYLLLGKSFDEFYHTAYDDRRLKALTYFLKQQQPDVIHLHHSLWVGLDFIDLVRKLLPHVKILYTLHEYLPICFLRGQLYRYHENGICKDTSPDQCVQCFPERTQDEFMLRRRTFRRAFAKVDRFIAPSDHLRQRYIEWGLAPSDIVVIPNGHRSRRPANWDPIPTPDVNVFGFFGQYVDAKGIDVLLQAASLAGERTGKPIEIRIFGGNKKYASEDYIAQISAVMAKMPDNVVVTEAGSYDRENVFDLMCGLDWVVVPSVWPESFVLVVSEAWDARRPVLASAAGALKDRIVDGRNGLGFTPGSAHELANLMSDCVGNAELWRALSSGIADEISVEDAWARHKDAARALSVPTHHAA